MLHYQTMEPGAYKLLNELMANQSLKDAGFFLVGGTSLALQLGHRMGTDLDLFTNKNIPAPKIKEFMDKTFGNRLEINSVCDLGFRGYLDGIKIDMVRFPFPMQHPPLEVDGMRLLNLRDAAAMKVHAIANRGARRDYVDMSELLQKYPMNKVMESYQALINPSPMAMQHTRLAMNYFGDAERTSANIDVQNGRTWTQTKQIIENSLQSPKHVQTMSLKKTVLPTNPHQINTLNAVKPASKAQAAKTELPPKAVPLVKPAARLRM